MKRNRTLLLKAAKRIEDIPQSYNQSEFRLKTNKSPCGTQACLAGEIVIASERSVSKGIAKLFRMRRDIGVAAAEMAGLDNRELTALFCTGLGWSWPQPFASRFDRAKSPKQRAKVAASLLRYLADGGEAA